MKNIAGLTDSAKDIIHFLRCSNGTRQRDPKSDRAHAPPVLKPGRSLEFINDLASSSTVFFFVRLTDRLPQIADCAWAIAKNISYKNGNHAKLDGEHHIKIKIENGLLWISKSRIMMLANFSRRPKYHLTVYFFCCDGLIDNHLVCVHTLIVCGYNCIFLLAFD